MTTPSILAITLARGGSKSIPLKNLALLSGKPLLSYTFSAALNCSEISRYIVSTDSLEIQSYCFNNNVDCPFIRPDRLSSDTSTSVEALQHAVTFCEQQDSVKYDYVVELMATNPFKTSTDISACIHKLIKTGADSVIGVSQLYDHHPARIKKIIDDTIVDFCVPELSSRRQELSPHAFIRNGSIYALNRDKLMHHNHRFGGSNSRPYVMPPEKSINIDSRLDLLLCEILINQ